MIQLAHIINPVKVKESSDLYYAQDITFESMRIAKRNAVEACGVHQYTVQYEEDHEIIPDHLNVLPNLERSVLDLNPNLSGRKLPLIADILAALHANSDADYFIYTNADIGLMPQFYSYVITRIAEGHDALVVNRRRLRTEYTKMEELPLIYSDLGRSHPGFDCFVFKRSLFEKFILGKICVGVSFIGVALAHNIFSFAENPLFLGDKHLTFHIGTDVLVPRNNAFYKHNKHEYFQNVEPRLKAKFELSKFPYANRPLPIRMLKWILNPSLFSKNYFSLEGKSFWNKCKTHLNEIRWWILQK